MSATLHTVIRGLFIGKVAHHWEGKPPSAIVKQRHEGPLPIDINGLVDDEQADLRVHGGPEKAIHHYAAEHLPYWQASFPDLAERFKPGCFGENISTEGIHEDNLCLGDILSMGSALVQVCQGRQPCWKLNAHMGIKTLAKEFQKTGWTGWYYRVIQDGSVAIGDSMILLERCHPEWPLRRLIEARFNRHLEPELARQLANMELLSQNWRAAFEKKSSPTYIEDTSRRLNPPS